jgi:hypothetical protein
MLVPMRSVPPCSAILALTSDAQATGMLVWLRSSSRASLLCDDQAGFDGDTIQQRAADQFAQEPWSKRFAEQDFLRAIGLYRSCALELQRPTVLIGNQQSADVTASIDFHGFHEAQSQWISFPAPDIPSSFLGTFADVRIPAIHAGHPQVRSLSNDWQPALSFD